MRNACKYALLLLVLVPCGAAAGELRVANVFTDHAVLQRDVRVPVWGTADAGETVTVHYAGQTKVTQAAGDESWRVALDPLKARSVGDRLVIESADQRIEYQNVLVGEVWYASGQSNMQMTLDACARKLQEVRDIVEAPHSDNIRMFRVDEADSPAPLPRLKKQSTWRVDLPDNRRRYSAVAYLFARQLHRALDVPVGVIEGSWGGKPIEGFIPREQFERNEFLNRLLTLAEQEKLDALASLKGGVVVRNTAGMPGRIFNARVAPIAPCAIRGFIWYQGESNAGQGEDPRDYRIKMRALAKGWRETWGQPSLPVYFVQLPAFRDTASGWVRLREEQRLSLAVEHTGMVVTIDLRDNDIHPANKLDVGKRLSQWALAKTYGQPVPFSGPLFASATVVGDSMCVAFQHAESGLMVARKDGLGPPKETPEVELAHFELATEAGQWHAATAKIEGLTVVVQSPAVSRPRAVRYACSGGPMNANLYNRDGLPASPFCSEPELLPWDRGP